MSGASSLARCTRRTRTRSSARASKCVLPRPPILTPPCLLLCWHGIQPHRCRDTRHCCARTTARSCRRLRTVGPRGPRRVCRVLATNLVHMLCATSIAFVMYENLSWLLKPVAASLSSNLQCCWSLNELICDNWLIRPAVDV